MTRRRNIQHGRKRRVPAGVLIPTLLLVVLIPVLIWELLTFASVIGGA